MLFSHDAVTIAGSFGVSPTGDTSNWLMFGNNSTNVRAAITDEGNILGDEPGLARTDMYVDARVVENDIANNAQNEYCSFGDGRIEYTTGGDKEYYYLTDHLGSTRAVINNEGTWTEVMAYDAYGAIIRNDRNTEQTDPTKKKFTGKEYDTSGYVEGLACGMKLDYFGKRYYDPEVGVWTSTDPKEQLFNPYGYSSNPTNTVDPNGEWIGLVMAGIAMAGWYGHNAVVNGSLNPGDWNWNDPNLIVSKLLTGLTVCASIGGEIAEYKANQLAAQKARQANWDKYVEAYKQAGFDINTGKKIEEPIQLAQRGRLSEEELRRMGELRGEGVFGSHSDWVTEEQYAAAYRNAPERALSSFRYTTKGETYIRYETSNSAFSRMTPTGVKPGTFAAPASDGIVPAGLQNSVYDLPMPDALRTEIKILTPPVGTPIIGPRPVLGGLGNEVFFPYGY